MEQHLAKSKFIQIYGPGECSVFFSPGRVNLIGEHLDYNGGYVFPCALSIGNYAAARKREDKLLNFVSGKAALEVTSNIDDLSYKNEDGWANYLKGTAQQFLNAGYAIGGLDLYIGGNLPMSGGLSSSASLELLMGTVLDTLFNCNVPRLDMIKMCQLTENEYMGLNTGIMDQYAVGFGKANSAILLNCQTTAHEYVPLNLEGYRLIIANTNKKRELVNSAYNKRRCECEQALLDLRSKHSINFLCDLSPDAFEADKGLIKDHINQKRAEHVIYENKRVLEAVDALKEGRLEDFGQFMNASHSSLRDLYEVTGPELDALAEEAWRIPGVLGSRMTGAGFGGCTVSVVAQSSTEEFIKHVGEKYYARTGLEADFYIADAGDCAKEIHIADAGDCAKEI
jgi:galactokinase